jgi:hypothetical protein
MMLARRVRKEKIVRLMRVRRARRERIAGVTGRRRPAEGSIAGATGAPAGNTKIRAIDSRSRGM